MQLLNKFRKMGTQGQVMVEMALSVPVMMMLVSAGVDFGGMTLMQHKMVAAAYEGTKIISQTMRVYTLECPGVEGVSLCPDITSRARVAMDESGLDSTGARNVTVVTKMVDSSGNPGHDFLMAGVKIDYPFSHLFSGALGFSENLLTTTSWTLVGALSAGTGPDGGKYCLRPGVCYAP